MSSDNARGKPVKSYDTLDVAVALLKRREGIDKTLKLVRYASIFAASEAKDAFGADSPFVASATALEKSIGNARRALRLGKFLGNVQDLRDELRDAQSRGVSVLKRWTSAAAACALLEGAYYFLEQGVWLSKAGVAMREKTTLDRLVRWSARAEVMSYVFSVSLSLDEARACVVARRRHERALSMELSRDAHDVNSDAVDTLRSSIARERIEWRRAVLAIVQDATDAVLSFEDALDVPGVELSHERFVNALGLLAAALDFHGKLTSAIESLDDE